MNTHTRREWAPVSLLDRARLNGRMNIHNKKMINSVCVKTDGNVMAHAETNTNYNGRGGENVGKNISKRRKAAEG
ncbi:hypothetical protein SAMN05518683_12527 [Salibacterium halotolerans]|uniref:Uncharacterized protein n=1 Tax=Salibacterium halotolerans TaxID=1884432 RepID=A0A1I5X6I3_9BACI|nr:hypothetical protein SAMN05518683_12527 [Salibacterium halotolerans]